MWERSRRERVFLKLGGSLITDKTRPLARRPEILARLGNEIREALDSRPGLELLVGHVLEDSRVKSLVDMVWHFEDVDDVRELTRLAGSEA